jgi:hypothetical protein
VERTVASTRSTGRPRLQRRDARLTNVTGGPKLVAGLGRPAQSRTVALCNNRARTPR